MRTLMNMANGTETVLDDYATLVRFLPSNRTDDVFVLNRFRQADPPSASRTSVVSIAALAPLRAVCANAWNKIGCMSATYRHDAG